MEDLFEISGIIVIITFILALSNFLVKYFYINFVSRIRHDQPHLVNAYKFLMKIITKNHRLIGTMSLVAVIIHAFTAEEISTTGLVAASIMGLIFLVGVYGAYIRKSNKGYWLIIHRVLTILLIVAILVHLA